MRKLLIALIGTITLTACTNEAYQTGDSALSYLTTEFVEAHTNGDAIITYGITDKGDSIPFSKPIKPSWAKQPDSLYRCLLFYKNQDIAKQVIILSRLSVLRIGLPHDKDAVHATDPLGFESGWVSENKKYLNLCVAIKTSKPNEDGTRHQLSVVCNDVKQFSGGTKTYYLELKHNRNNISEYYTQKVYLSIPIHYIEAGSTIKMNINTYQGVIEKEFRLSVAK